MKTFILPASVTGAAQDTSFEVFTDSLHPDAIAAIWTYGVRRWVQDNVNAQAHAHKKAAESGETTEPFDATGAVAARIEQASTGNLVSRATSRRPALSAFDEALIALSRTVRNNPGFGPLAAVYATAKDLPIAERKAAILDCIAALPVPARDAMHKAAQATVDANAMLTGLDLT